MAIERETKVQLSQLGLTVVPSIVVENAAGMID